VTALPEGEPLKKVLIVNSISALYVFVLKFNSWLSSYKIYVSILNSTIFISLRKEIYVLLK